MRRRAAMLAFIILAGSHAAAYPNALSSTGSWSLSLTLRSGNMVDTVELGAQPGATSQFDTGTDRPEPPAPPGRDWVQTFAMHPTATPGLDRLDRSIVAPAPLQSWNVTLRGGPDVATAELAWDLESEAEHAVELLVGDLIIDLRELGALSVDLTAGSIIVRIDAYVLDGEPPAPPRDLLAIPGDALGEITLTWSAPDDDGGLPLRGYHLYEEVGDTLVLLAKLRLVTTYVDRERGLGMIVRYRVDAFNALAASDVSNVAIGIGTARGTLLAPASDPGERQEIAGSQAHTGPVADAIPPATLEGEPNGTDPRNYDLHVDAAGQSHTIGIFTGALLDETIRVDTQELAELATMSLNVSVAYSAEHTELVVLVHASGPAPVEEEFAVAPEPS